MQHSLYIVKLTALAVGLLFLAACTSQPTVTTQPGTPTPVPSATQTPTHMPPSPSPTPSPTASPQPPLTLMSIHMMTAMGGWATGQITGTQTGGVFRTTDGGAHWRNVSPPGISLTPNVPAYFPDLISAWVAVSSPSPSATGSTALTVTIYRTTDGGQTWQGGVPLSIPGGIGPGVLDFIDAQHGWLMVSLGVAAGSEAVEIFRTNDGGIHWEEVSLTSANPQQSTPGSLPFGCDKSGITFRDAATGWATGSCPGGSPFFYVTHDGGQTWQLQTLPPPPGFPGNILSSCQCGINPPTFASPLDGFLPVGIYTTSQSEFLYVTHDGGKTWSPNPLPVTHLLGRPAFIDANNGWITDGQQLYVTHDSGQTWAAVARFPTVNLLGNLDFVDASNGWFTDGQQLYVTHAGGLSWATLTPVLFVSVSPSPTPTPVGISIEVLAGPVKTTIAPNETAVVPFHNGEVYVLVHLPYLIQGRAQAQIVQQTAGNWQVEVKNQPNGDTYAFALRGSAPGRVTVEVTQGQDLPPLRFTIQIQSGTPSPATHTITLDNNG